MKTKQPPKQKTDQQAAPAEQPKKLTGEVDEKQLDKWKKEHPDGIYAIVVDESILYFRKPGRKDLNYAHTKYDANEHSAYYDALADITYLGGDEDKMKDDQAMVSINAYMEQMDAGKRIIILNL